MEWGLVLIDTGRDIKSQRELVRAYRVEISTALTDYELFSADYTYVDSVV